MTQRDILRRLIATTSQFMLEIRASPSYHVDNIPLPHVPRLRLRRFISHFRSEMCRTGFLPQIRKLASAKATELAQYYQKSYERACYDTLNTPRNQEEVTAVIGSLRLTYEALYEKRDLPRFLDDALKAQDTYFNNCKQHPSSTSSKVRPAFNQEYTPLLEKYFEHNAYPSTRDRLVLAQKSMMTPRQIEVWFQNHRNRGKKEGIILKRRMSDSLPCDFPFQSLESRIPSLTMLDNQKNELDEQESSDESLDEDDIRPLARDSFSASAPDHAYPTKYPPNHVPDPFPNQNGVFKFQPPQWRRKPATKKNQAPLISMDEIIIMFTSKLNLRGGVSEKQHFTHTKSRQPWFAATITAPCPAPLPALIRASPMRSLTLVYTSSPPLACDVQHLSPQARSRLLSPDTSSFTHTIPRSRKLAPLPHRMPKSLSPTFDTPSSRTSSLNSTASLQSRSTSSSSVSLTDTLPLPLSRTHESQNAVFTHEQLQLLNGFFSPASNHSSKEGASQRRWGLSWNDVVVNQIPSILLPTLSLPSTNYLAAQS